jgi:Ser/Thr protein kinase RdoA (MazF antagonist)
VGGAESAPEFDEAARAALAEFDIGPADVERIFASENVTFRAVTRRTGDAYTLRLHRPGYHDLSELASERLWLRALAAAGISTPVGVSAPDGREFVPVPVGWSGTVRYASLSRWVDGEVVSAVLRRRNDPALEQHYVAQLGAIMAAMHNQACSWEPPAGFTRWRLDVDGLLGAQPYWGRFWEYHALTPHEERTLLRARDDIVEVLLAYGCQPSTFSLIHGDMNHDNLIVTGDRVTVIDFDDAGFGWHLYDMAIALNGCSTPVLGASEAAFLDGYRSARTIGDDDLALLPMFRLVREMALLGWKGQRPEVEWAPGRVERMKADVLARAAAFDAAALLP